MFRVWNPRFMLGVFIGLSLGVVKDDLVLGGGVALFLGMFFGATGGGNAEDPPSDTEGPD